MEKLVHAESSNKDGISSDKEIDNTDKAFEVSTFSIFSISLCIENIYTYIKIRENKRDVNLNKQPGV